MHGILQPHPHRSTALGSHANSLSAGESGITPETTHLLFHSISTLGFEFVDQLIEAKRYGKSDTEINTMMRQRYEHSWDINWLNKLNGDGWKEIQYIVGSFKDQLSVIANHLKKGIEPQERHQEIEVFTINSPDGACTHKIFASEGEIYIRDVLSKEQSKLMSVAQFLTCCACEGVNLTKLNLSSMDLRSANLSNMNLAGADLSRADLTGVDLSFVDLTGAILFKTNLTKTNLGNANLSGANLTKSQLNYANLASANLTNAQLVKAEMLDAILTKTNLTKANLTEANLSRAYLFQAKLLQAILNRTVLVQANLTQADLNNAKLIFAKMDGANLSYANLNSADLTDVNLVYTNLNGAILSKAILCGTLLPESSNIHARAKL